ncbi:hypothetical protein MF406_00460 [Georgenia sp. TF02-10]|uniref:spore germination protein GerW family protein n=1 Tax=Georgenia sp. TF02-10 TaxID=2917725 RepID=UPI001FA7CB1B|nr:spore germination protein GerW family protein [Georgenia sp. TF02-10]UNX54815.1 hypothetical protein MF406_00460 [Georgenia sp. TF02-10]
MEHPGGASVDMVTGAAKDVLTVRRVFGEPYTSGDTTVIPVAKVMGGSGMGFGGGEGPSDQESGEGGGGGFGVRARPVGAYVVRGGEVHWRPSVDVNRLATGGQLVLAIAVLAWALRRR